MRRRSPASDLSGLERGGNAVAKRDAVPRGHLTSPVHSSPSTVSACSIPQTLKRFDTQRSGRHSLSRDSEKAETRYTARN